MRKRSSGSAVRSSLLALLLVALAIPCAAQERPFQLQGSTKVLGNPFAPGGAGMDGQGTATHLGRWTNTGQLAIDPSSGPPFAASGIAHFIAADGDQLDVSLTGSFAADFSATGVYTMLGGTGRFSAASGTGTLAVHLTGDTLHYEASGTIDY